MLLLAALVSTAAWSCGFAQEIPVQRPLSLTKSKGSVRLECRFNDISGDFDGATIHWYQQKTNKAPERILYLSGTTKVVDKGFQEPRYRVEKFSSQKLCILTINDVTPDDTATYYCAYWYDHCDKGQSQPSNFEILQKKHKNQMMYVCLIEKFYPEVIRVTWTEGENQKVTENIVKGEAWRPTEEDKYSISSWLTVPEENKDKKYFCNYEHESGKGSRANEDSSQKEECIPSPGNSTVVFNRDHLYHRTAYLVYIVLLLKSSMYYLIVLFFIYRAWAPTKHRRKKA